MYSANEALGIPVRKAEAAARLRAADLLGDGCAVDAIAREVESDPNSAYWVVGARRDNKLGGDPFPLGGVFKNCGVEGVVRVFNADFNSKLSTRALINVSSDAYRAMEQELTLCI